MRKALVLALTLTTAACAGNLPETIQNGDPRDEIAALSAFAIRDLQTANRLAAAKNDRIAVMCWSDLIETAELLRTIASDGVIGPATKWQIARNLRRSEHEACDALVSDARSTLFRIAGRLGVAIPGL